MKTSSCFRAELLEYRNFYIVSVRFSCTSLYVTYDKVFHSLGSVKKFIDEFYTDRKFKI